MDLAQRVVTILSQGLSMKHLGGWVVFTNVPTNFLRSILAKIAKLLRTLREEVLNSHEDDFNTLS